LENIGVVSLTPEEKKKGLASLKNSLKKKWGDGVIIDHEKMNIEFVSTGSPLLDAGIGGGIPRGRFIEIYGDESSGKTTTTQIAMAEFQKKFPDQLVGFIDVEHAINIQYANSLGLDTSSDKFILSQPGSAEEALEILLQFCESGLFSVIAFDSIGGLMTQSQLEKGIDEETMGALARVMSKCASRIHTAANDTNTTVIWINQTRNKIVMMGNPETVSGGKTLPFFHSVRIKVRKTGPVVVKEVAIGQEVEYKIIKNKVGVPFGVINTSLFFNVGFDAIRETIDVAYKVGTIYSSGAWAYVHKGTENEVRWNGKAACIQWYRDNPVEYAELHARTFAAVEIPKDIVIEPEDEDGQV
jgi:recombination protein RecA